MTRLAPLAGLLFAVLAAVAFASSQVPPDAKASGQKVIAFYQAHSSGQQRSDYFWMLSFAFLLLFAGSLRTLFRQARSAEGLGSLVLAGAAVLVAGATMFFGFDYALAVVPSHLDPGAAQALNVLALKLIFPMSAGGFVFGLATGLAILRSGLLPAWLGWTALVIAIAFVTPGAIIGLVLLMLWSLVVSVLMWRRAGGSEALAT